MESSEDVSMDEGAMGVSACGWVLWGRGGAIRRKIWTAMQQWQRTRLHTAMNRTAEAEERRIMTGGLERRLNLLSASSLCVLFAAIVVCVCG
jgi:hypothetical protein